VAKAKWAYEECDVNGTFLWTIGGEGDNLSLLTRISEHVAEGYKNCGGNDDDEGDDDNENDEGSDDEESDDDESDNEGDDNENDEEEDDENDNDSDDDQSLVSQFGAYWAGWTGDTHQLYNDYVDLNMSTLYLAFADFKNGAIDTSISGHLTDIPAEGTQMMPTYINWTKFAHRSPDTKIILSLGGATFDAIWSGLDDNKIESISQAVKTTLDAQYPAYSGNFANSDELLGHVTIHGIDLDVELGGQAFSDSMTESVAKLIIRLKEILPADKLITMATFSVAADPTGACTVPGSAHCGEIIPLME